ncbi:hypothetical protein INT45_009740 [Circinella minor]|uniref:Uncharacterized protein n=1 Tax=Circinella minor TaxID=1195481 RepID=A0A8H7S3H6_9FUNG|nr:hypothetical protein INT45_009740 [Circinella minor]
MLSSSHTASNTFSPLINRALQIIRNRIENIEHDLQAVDENAISFLFKRDAQSNIQIIQEIMVNNMLINDNDLISLLDLHIATQEKAPFGTTVYYVRSFRLTCDNLRNLLDMWGPDSQIETWKRFSQNYPQNDIYLRYIGKVTGDSPLSRHIDDANKATGFLGKFYNTIKKIDPDLIDKAKLHEFYNARLDGSQHTKNDLPERIAIAFFGIDNLLNVQYGGEFNAYQPPHKVFEAFRYYNLTFFHDFESADNQQTSAKELIPWMHAVQQEQQKVELQTGKTAPPSSLIKTIHRQAIIQRKYNQSILVLIGRDLTNMGYSSGQGFFSESRAGDLTKRILCRQRSWANGIEATDARSFDSTPFPFVDLFPWPGRKNNPEGALRQLCQYVKIVQPLITVTFSVMVTSVAFSNFLHFQGIMNQRNDSFMDLVGIPCLRYILDESWVNDSTNGGTPPENNLTIVVPHVHPGFERYGAYSAVLNYLLDLTWTITLIIGEIAIKYAKQTNQQSRGRLIHKIWNACNPESDNLDVRLAQAYGALSDIKDKLKIYRENKRKQNPPVVRRSADDTLHEASILRMGRYGTAQSKPNSDKRLDQVNKLWKINYPALHIHISRFSKDEWYNWATNLNENDYFFASAMRHVGMQKHHPLRNALNIFRPADQYDSGIDIDDDDSWLYDEDLVSEAAEKWGKSMKRHLPDDHFSSENQRRRRQKALLDKDAEEYSFTERVENRLVYVPATSPAIFRWNDNGSEKRLELKFPKYIVPQLNKENRMFRIRFLDDGIGLDDENGNPFIGNDPNKRFVITCARLQAVKHGHDLMRLWRKEREYITGVPSIVTPNFAGQTARGRPAWKNNTRNKTFVLPINENADSLGLLQQFLNKEFPEGGLISLVSNDVAPHIKRKDAIPIQSLLDSFLEDNRHHPFYYEWKNWNDDIAKGGRHYYPNIQFLRPDARVDSDNEKVIVNGSVRRVSYIEFGPPQ